MDVVIQLLNAAIASGTPLLFATLGGILIERSGVIQLGAEGLMLMGVVCCLSYLSASGSLTLTLLAVIAVSAVLGLLHASLTVSLRTNQIVTGLALTLFGSGLSAYLGKPVSGIPVPHPVPKVNLSWLDGIPVVGDVLGHLDMMTWISFILVLFAMHLFIHRTSWGLHLRAIGDNPPTAAPCVNGESQVSRISIWFYYCRLHTHRSCGRGFAACLYTDLK